jgi:hypothetical protein
MSEASTAGGWTRWRPFLLGLIAPFAAPFLVFLILGAHTNAWMHGTVWLVLLVLGFVAGVQHRRWGFLLGVVVAIGAFSALTYLAESGWLTG